MGKLNYDGRLFATNFFTNSISEKTEKFIFLQTNLHFSILLLYKQKFYEKGTWTFKKLDHVPNIFGVLLL